ncbi:MAG: hypothetical protein IJZ54_05600 [Clostridia bacterium]|nr:hypothetical protein [Clostridia bacterium]
MDKNKAWEIFAASGKIEDYLNFKSALREDSPQDNINADKNKDKRTDYKTTEYR